jgi:hypothetical protein
MTILLAARLRTGDARSLAEVRMASVEAVARDGSTADEEHERIGVRATTRLANNRAPNRKEATYMERDEECGCSQAISLNELCPQCRADYDEYLTTIAMLRESVAKSQPPEVKHGDAA